MRTPKLKTVSLTRIELYTLVSLLPMSRTHGDYRRNGKRAVTGTLPTAVRRVTIPSDWTPLRRQLETQSGAGLHET